MNFKTIRKVGLSALLAGTFAFSADETAAAPVFKDSGVTTMTAKQADRKMFKTFKEQEKLLSAEQKEMWGKVKNHPDFPHLFSSVKMNMDITKIKQNINYIMVPFDDVRTVNLYKGGGQELRIAVGRHDDNRFVVPTHEVPDFIKDKADCYFYTSLVDLNKLTESEQDSIKTLDKCLNKIYHFMYGTGFANIDKDKMAKGKYAGFVYETHRLSRKKSTEYKSLKKDRTELENKIFDFLGYPLQVSEIGGWFGEFGGCTGEIHYVSNFNAGLFGVPWAKDISKEGKLINYTLAQATLRQKTDIHVNKKCIEEGFKTLIEEGFPSASKEFKNLLNNKFIEAKTFNRLLLKHAKQDSPKIEKSLAHTGVLNIYIRGNFDERAKDNHEPVTITKRNLTGMTQKNRTSTVERGFK